MAKRPGLLCSECEKPSRDQAVKPGGKRHMRSPESSLSFNFSPDSPPQPPTPIWSFHQGPGHCQGLGEAMPCSVVCMNSRNLWHSKATENKASLESDEEPWVWVFSLAPPQKQLSGRQPTPVLWHWPEKILVP